jgi:hypothetical protein
MDFGVVLDVLAKIKNAKSALEIESLLLIPRSFTLLTQLS